MATTWLGATRRPQGSSARRAGMCAADQGASSTTDRGPTLERVEVEGQASREDITQQRNRDWALLRLPKWERPPPLLRRSRSYRRIQKERQRRGKSLQFRYRSSRHLHLRRSLCHRSSLRLLLLHATPLSCAQAQLASVPICIGRVSVWFPSTMPETPIASSALALF